MGVSWPRTTKQKRRESGPEKHARGKRDPNFFLPNGGENGLGDLSRGTIKHHYQNNSKKISSSSTTHPFQSQNPWDLLSRHPLLVDS